MRSCGRRDDRAARRSSHGVPGRVQGDADRAAQARAVLLLGEPLMPLTPDAVVRLTDVMRQLRAIPQVRERAPGTFVLVGQPFVQIDEAGDVLVAQLRKLSGTGFDAFPVGEPPDRRRFVDEAKRRAAKITDD